MTEHWLYPCPSCDRHVQSSASQCPWCGAVLPPSPPRPRRLAESVDLRAMALLYGAPPPPRDLAPMYGAPPPPLRRTLPLLILVGVVLMSAWLVLSKLLHVF